MESFRKQNKDDGEVSNPSHQHHWLICISRYCTCCETLQTAAWHAQICLK